MKLTDQERAIVVEEICTIIDNLLDILIAVDPAPPYLAPFIGWELPASRERGSLRRRAWLMDNNTDLTRPASLSTFQRSTFKRSNPLHPWAYPMQAVWDKKIRTSRN